jgi:catechol 2,3-dioxygenase-like lactoylglutathione lyase family enzyme
MEHFLVLTDDVDRTRDFYCDALGMRVGPRPPIPFAGYWMYLGDSPAFTSPIGMHTPPLRLV